MKIKKCFIIQLPNDHPISYTSLTSIYKIIEKLQGEKYISAVGNHSKITSYAKMNRFFQNNNSMDIDWYKFKNITAFKITVTKQFNK